MNLKDFNWVHSTSSFVLFTLVISVKRNINVQDFIQFLTQHRQLGAAAKESRLKVVHADTRLEENTLRGSSPSTL